MFINCCYRWYLHTIGNLSTTMKSLIFIALDNWNSFTSQSLLWKKLIGGTAEEATIWLVQNGKQTLQEVLPTLVDNTIQKIVDQCMTLRGSYCGKLKQRTTENCKVNIFVRKSIQPYVKTFLLILSFFFCLFHKMGGITFTSEALMDSQQRRSWMETYFALYIYIYIWVISYQKRLRGS